MLRVCDRVPTWRRCGVHPVLAIGLVFVVNACGHTTSHRAPASTAPPIASPRVEIVAIPESTLEVDPETEVDNALFAAIDMTDLMDAVGRDVIDAPPHGTPSKAPCPIDTSPVRDPTTRELYANHRFAMVPSTMAAGHARYAATVTERVQASMSGDDWPGAHGFPYLRMHVSSTAGRDVERAAIAPISYKAALAELRDIADPAWWTWDLVVIFSGGGNRADGAHLFGDAYVIDYQAARAVCFAHFDVPVGTASHYDRERAVDAVLLLLRALR
jgi:hypothetical protein